MIRVVGRRKRRLGSQLASGPIVVRVSADIQRRALLRLLEAELARIERSPGAAALLALAAEVRQFLPTAAPDALGAVFAALSLGRFSRDHFVEAAQQRRAGQRKGAAATGSKAAIDDDVVRRYELRWRASDEIQSRYPSAARYIANQTGIPIWKVRRRRRVID